jgi:hypothetical protein
MSAAARQPSCRAKHELRACPTPQISTIIVGQAIRLNYPPETGVLRGAGFFALVSNPKLKQTISANEIVFGDTHVDGFSRTSSSCLCKISHTILFFFVILRFCLKNPASRSPVRAQILQDFRVDPVKIAVMNGTGQFTHISV